MLAFGTKLLGYVEVRVGAQTVRVPVESAAYRTRDRAGGAEVAPGGLFVDRDSGDFGILVDDAASPEVTRERIAEAAEEAARILARRLTN